MHKQKLKLQQLVVVVVEQTTQDLEHLHQTLNNLQHTLNDMEKGDQQKLEI